MFSKVLYVMLLACVSVALVGCQPAGTCNNSISGSNNLANCGGPGDGQDVDQTTPAPVIVPPVVITPVTPESEA